MLLYELYDAEKPPKSKSVKKKLKVKQKHHRKHVQPPEYPKPKKNRRKKLTKQ